MYRNQAEKHNQQNQQKNKKIQIKRRTQTHFFYVENEIRFFFRVRAMRSVSNS